MVDGYKISTDADSMDVGVIHRYLTHSYWARGISEETVRRAVQNSLCFGILTGKGDQVGFARVITDRATFAYLADVFVLEGHRGRGLSKWLLEVLVGHRSLQGVRRFTLATRDAHGLYEQFGFQPLANPQIFMEIWRPEVYTEPSAVDD